MTYRRIIRVVARGMLFVYGVTLAGDCVLLSQSPHHEQRADSFGLLATSTASDSGFIAVQNAISGEEVQLPPRPGVRIIKFT
jgi:hypothetical protein